MRYKHSGRMLAMTVLGSLCLLAIQASTQEKKAKTPAGQAKPAEQAVPKVLVVHPQAEAQQKPPTPRPRFHRLSQAVLLKIARQALPSATSVTPYLTQLAPQIYSDKGQFIYFYPKVVDPGLAYFYEPTPDDSTHIGSLEFGLYGEAGHQYLVLLYLTYANPPTRQFKVCGFQVSTGTCINNESTVFSFNSPGGHQLQAFIDLSSSSASTGWHYVRVDPPQVDNQPSYGGEWYFVAAVVYLVQ